MAVVSVDRIFEQCEASWNRLYQRTYTLAWRVECDSRLDGPYTIRAATSAEVVGGKTVQVPLLPRIGWPYWVSDAEQDAWSFASQVDYRCEAIYSAGGVDGIVWVVTVQYTPYDAAQFGDTPVDWPVKVSFSSNKYDRLLTIDQNGTPILNSAGEPFADPITYDDNRSIITVVRNEPVSAIPASAGPPATPAIPGFDFTLAEAYRDTVNQDAWNGFAAKTVKCSSITTSDPQFDDVNGYWYFAVTYVFEVNRDDWRKRVVDQGFTDISTLDSTKRLKILDASGQPKDEPTLLNGSGHRLAVGGTPVVLTFDAYPALDFTLFNIDFNAAIGRS